MNLSFFELLIIFLSIIPGYFIVELLGKKYPFYTWLNRYNWDVLSRLIHYGLASYVAFLLLFYFMGDDIAQKIDFSESITAISKIYGESVAQKVELILFIILLDTLLIIGVLSLYRFVKNLDKSLGNEMKNLKKRNEKIKKKKGSSKSKKRNYSF